MAGIDLRVELGLDNPEDLAQLVQAYQNVCDVVEDQPWNSRLRETKKILRKTISSLRVRGVRPPQQK